MERWNGRGKWYSVNRKYENKVKYQKLHLFSLFVKMPDCYIITLWEPLHIYYVKVRGDKLNLRLLAL